MKHFLRSLLFIALLTNNLFAQQSLTTSRQSGHYTYIYKLTDQEAFSIAAKSNAAVTDAFMHNLVDSFKVDLKGGYTKKLALGNYLYVTPRANKLVYSLEQVGNVNLHFIDNLKDFQFSITDLKGVQVSDADVSIGKGKKVKYDQKAGLYVSKRGINPSVIAVKHEGITNYFTFREQKPWVMPKGRNTKAYGGRSVDVAIIPKPKYSGYMVFNKPMFKPLDTVKFKTYLVNAKGKSAGLKSLRMELFVRGEEEDGKVLGMVSPYRNGGYEGSFVLSDSLDLDLDEHYELALSTKKGNKWVKVYSGIFRYEDYELKSINFTARTDKDIHFPGNPITLYMKAADENDLAVPDGRVQIQAISRYVNKFYEKKDFIRDTLWTKDLVLDPVGETKLVLPDSIFPRADMEFVLYLTFLNSNNETQSAQKYLSFNLKNEDVKMSLKGDTLLFDYLFQGKSAKQKGILVSYFSNGQQRDSVAVELPATLKLDEKLLSFKFKSSAGFEKTIFLNTLPANLSVLSSHTRDSLKFEVVNPYHVPFWYTVFSDQRILLKGYTTKLDTAIKHAADKNARIRINYLWGGSGYSTDGDAIYREQLLDVKLNGPDVVYPGQIVNMQVKVTDAEGKPAKNTDVTAMAYTAKFKTDTWLNVPYFGRKISVLKPAGTIGTEPITLNGSLLLNWQKWGKELGLDTIEHYRFCNTKGVYVNQESIIDTAIAQIAPFLVKDGTIEPVSIVYIDEVPVFFSQADQLQRYVFKVAPGMHSIRLRSMNFAASLRDFELLKGKKTIIAILADEKNTKAAVTKEKASLSNIEAEHLDQYMIRIQDTFDEEKATIESEDKLVLLNPPPAVRRNGGLLVGPFQENYLHYVSGGIDQHFLKEKGYAYTFLPGLLKQKSSGNPYLFNEVLSDNSNGNTDYAHHPLTRKEADSIWNEYLDLRSSTTQLFNNRYAYGNGRLRMQLDTTLAKGLPYLKNIIIFKNDEPDFVQVYPGSTTTFNELEADIYHLLYLFKDNRYFVEKNIRINAPGQNYFEWAQVKVVQPDQLSKAIDQQIKSVKSFDMRDRTALTDQIADLFNKEEQHVALTVKMSGKVFDQQFKTPLSGVTVKIKGLSINTFTDAKGEFSLDVPKKGRLLLSFAGYDHLILEIKEGKNDSIFLRPNKNDLDEVSVVGYGVQTKKMLTGSVSRLAGVLDGGMALQEVVMGAATGIQVRGLSRLKADQEVLYILDGLPVSADKAKLNPDLVANMVMLKGDEATAIYGSKAVNGVVIITTKAGNQTMNGDADLEPQQQTLRSNFSDYAIWQPKLLTDQDGQANFKVKFPDDITSWNTKLIAMNGNKQSGMIETNIRSFKILSANFVSPQFALPGDSIYVIGKLMNYSPVAAQAQRKFSYNGTELLSGLVNIKNAHIDTMAIVAKGKDSLQFEYTMKQDNGYFDGEIRKIPLLQTGVLETKGYFNALLRDTTINYQFDADLGKVSLRAEGSVFPVLLDEMEKLRNYEYLCNEQMASKLKALLLEKTVRKYLGSDFKNERAIKELIKKLQANKRPEGTWGWWQSSSTELWISLHVAEALLAAQQQGYSIALDRQKIQAYLTNQLAYGVISDRLMAIKLLKTLDEKAYIKDFVLNAEKQKPLEKQTLFERLQVMRLKQVAGMEIDVKGLLAIKKQTMFGNIYWGESSNNFWNNSIQNTLLVYQILKATGKFAEEQDAILRYFLEQRKDGKWRNTYESSLILESILPGLMKDKQLSAPVSIVLNENETVSTFPFTKTIDATKSLNIQKKGKGAVYITAYQQFNNPAPQKVSKDFTVKSWFEENKNPVKALKAGKQVVLKVSVDVHADADYVMIEIPIPAGCSYQHKEQQFWGIETHREYFKDKTSIFCTKLRKGVYNFEINLMPRYSGNYSLNPAKAEMMYFPVFYGREGMKRISIKY